ncbi:MAG: hypothetical protein KKE77_12090 [Alphaproteobacteria bacterium]|nr:hypothetical protein [Alphaproteobacteria bacterium]
MTAKRSAKGSEQSGRETRHSKVLEQAMEAASAAMRDAGQAYAAAGLDRSARHALAEGAMQEAGKHAEEAVKAAMAQVEKAMDQMPHRGRSER